MSRLERFVGGCVREQPLDSSAVPNLRLQMPPTLVPQGQLGASSFEVDKPSARLRQKYSNLRDEGNKKNDLLTFAHRSVQRDSTRQNGLSSGEIPNSCGSNPRRSPPRKVYIQNSSALVRREQELLKKGTLARGDSTGTTVTRSLTASIVSSSELTLTEVLDADSTHSVEHGEETREEVLAKPFAEETTVQSLSDDEDYEEESDDEREWRKDSNVMNIPKVASDEDQVYEDSCSSSSGYVTEDHNIDPSDNSSEASSMSSLNSSTWRMNPISEEENESETEPETDKSDVSAQKSESEGKVKTKTDTPVAVVFEMDDMTDDSQVMSEDGLLRFVKDFTEEMKDTTEDDVDKTPSRPSVRIYSTLGAKRSDLKSLKQKVLSSETIVSTILENRVRYHEKKGDALQEDGPVHQGVATSVASTHERKFSKDFSSSDIVAAIREGKANEATTMPEHMEKFCQTPHGASEVIAGSEIKGKSAVANAMSVREQLQQRRRAREAKASEILMTAKGKCHVEHLSEETKNEPALNTTTSTLREEIARRRQRIKSLRESQNATSEVTMSRDDARSILEQRREHIKSVREGQTTTSGGVISRDNDRLRIRSLRKVSQTQDKSTTSDIASRQNCFDSELKAAMERRRERQQCLEEVTDINIKPNIISAVHTVVPVDSTSQSLKQSSDIHRRPNATPIELPATVGTANLKGNNVNTDFSRKLKHEDSSAGTLTVITSNRTSEEEKKRREKLNKKVATSRSSRKANFGGLIGRFIGSGGKKSHKQATNSASVQQQQCSSSVVTTPSRRPKKDDRSITRKRDDRFGSFPVGNPRSSNLPRRIPLFNGHCQRHAPIPNKKENLNSPIISTRSGQDGHGDNFAEGNSPHRRDKKLLPDDLRPESPENEAKYLRIHCSDVHLRSTLDDVDVISFDELCTSTALASASWV